MSLDDRMRQAYGRQLDDVRRRVEERDLLIEPAPEGSAVAGRLLTMAAALLLIGVGGLALARLAGDSSSVVTTDPAGDRSAPSVPPEEGGPPVVTVDPDPEDAVAPETVSETGPTAPAGGSSPTTPSNVEGADRPTTELVDPGELETGLDKGVTNEVCPSGQRADLERATIAYVGTSRGWERKDDLVDEQDGPFYFEAWEPGYVGSVEVEIVLARPVSAREIRVAQDPFTPVSGTITITVDGRSTGVELDGTGGWRSLAFEQPIVIDRFRLRRDQADANIMEVLVCVDAPSS